LGEGQREQIVRRSALRRPVGADDVAAAVEFLLSENAKEHHGHYVDRGCRQYGLSSVIDRCELAYSRSAPARSRS